MTTKKTNRKKIILGCVCAVIILLLAVDIFGANYLVNYAIGRAGDGGNRNVALEVEQAPNEVEQTINERRKLQNERTDAFLKECPGEIIKLNVADNKQLSGVYYSQKDSHLWAITIHGYRGSHDSGAATSLAQNYYANGYQVVSPDLRACGDSYGNYVGMGWLDRKDLLLWIDWIIEQDSQAKIVLHGISMGAATTMMTAGENTPDAVKAFVEDCGYTCVWDIFSNELKLRFGMPEFPLLYTANMLSKVKAGYSFKEASSLKQLENATKPMLFIHGTSDDFIPYEMMDVVYNAKAGDNKKKVTAPGAGHGEAMYALGDEYWNEVFAFLGEYMN